MDVRLYRNADGQMMAEWNCIVCDQPQTLGCPEDATSMQMKATLCKAQMHVCPSCAFAMIGHQSAKILQLGTKEREA